MGMDATKHSDSSQMIRALTKYGVVTQKEFAAIRQRIDRKYYGSIKSRNFYIEEARMYVKK